jgi:hypothetical protein
LDGSEYAFFIAKADAASADEGSFKWIIFMNGGGYCTVSSAEQLLW